MRLRMATPTVTLPGNSQHGYYTILAKRCAAIGRPYDRRHISNVLNGRVGYSRKSLPIIAQACGVTEQELIDYIDYIGEERDE